MNSSGGENFDSESQAFPTRPEESPYMTYLFFILKILAGIGSFILVTREILQLFNAK